MMKQPTADEVIPKGDCEALVTAVLEWRTAKRQHAKLGADNYFHHSPEKEQLFKDSSRRIRVLGEKMNKLLDGYEAKQISLPAPGGKERSDNGNPTRPNPGQPLQKD